MVRRSPSAEALGTELCALGAAGLQVENLVWPVFLLDEQGTIRWQNDAAVKLVGDRRRGRFLNVVAPDYRHTVQLGLARIRIGETLGREHELVLLGPSRERRRVHATGIPLTNGDQVVGTLGMMRIAETPERSPAATRLAPRQHETLRLLATGRSTEEIAAELGVTRETARGYIRRLLRRLGVRSRLEAVVRGRELDLI